MKNKSIQRVVLINLMIALAISLIVNFSYFILSLMSSQGIPSGREARVIINPQLYISVQVIYWFVLAFILLCISTYLKKGDQQSGFTSKILYCVIVAATAYLFAPTTNREGEILIMAASRRIFNPMVLLKGSFTLIVAVLYGKIFELVYQKQSVIIENEQLKNENLLTRYNMLMSQVNPHFFFNSLNSLSMLVREKHNEKALIYIDRLSDMFRYIIRSGHNEMVTLEQEVEFLTAYRYVHEVRYADKLFFDIEIDQRYMDWILPVLSLQPLVENAVKHNSITLSNPFHVSIRTGDGELIISNPILPKIEPEISTGIGLRNLSSRMTLLTGKDIIIERNTKTFCVRLPLTPPSA